MQFWEKMARKQKKNDVFSSVTQTPMQKNICGIMFKNRIIMHFLFIQQKTSAFDRGENLKKN